MDEKNYTPSAGSKLEYSTSESGTYTRIHGLLSTPSIGEEPNKIDTTTLDNEKYETNVNGLMPAPNLNYEFNMEDPDVEANINQVNTLAESGNTYYWKLTMSNGIVHSYRSKVTYGFKEVGVNEISGFTMYHAPIGEIVTTIPTTSA